MGGPTRLSLLAPINSSLGVNTGVHTPEIALWGITIASQAPIREWRVGNQAFLYPRLGMDPERDPVERLMSEVYSIIPREGPITWEQRDAVMALLTRRAQEQARIRGVPYEPSIWIPIFEQALRDRCPQPTIWEHLDGV